MAALIAAPAFSQIATRDFTPCEPPMLEHKADIPRQAPADDGEWIKLGTGMYTDFIVSAMYGYKADPIEADFQQSKSDPTTFRIYRPYANWTDKRPEGLTYNPANATPLVFHLIDGGYAWFEAFDTGFYVDTADQWGPIVGEVTVTPSMQTFIKSYGLQTVIDQIPTSLCKFNDGTLTLTYSCMVPTNSGYQPYPNICIEVDGEEMWDGNKNDALCMMLPDARDLASEFKWKPLDGNALFVDGFSSLFAYQDEPKSPEFDVEIQQNEADPNLYRLVNPYADWDLDYSAYEFDYDTNDNYYMKIYTFPEYGNACTNTFYTGLMTRIKGEDEPFEMFGVQSQAYYFHESYAKKYGWYLSETAHDFGYMFGKFEDGVFSCPATYEDEYYGQIVEFPTFTGWRGSYDEAIENDWTYAVNRQGTFKVVFPSAREENTSAVGNIITDADAVQTEYYDLTGRRVLNPAPGSIVIERRGNQAVKIIR